MVVKDLIKIIEENNNLQLCFMLPDSHEVGELIPPHFHITEVGYVNKQFIDCGGTKRGTTTCLLQVWVSDDVDHRLTADKLVKILHLAQDKLGAVGDIEIEYGECPVAKYWLNSVEITSQFKIKEEVFPPKLLFVFDHKKTDCLDKARCGCC